LCGCKNLLEKCLKLMEIDLNKEEEGDTNQMIDLIRAKYAQRMSVIGDLERQVKEMIRT
jgi:hypothetical protein